MYPESRELAKREILSVSPARKPSRRDQAGKVGLALLMWILGVPGGIVLLYLLFAH